VTRRAPGLAAAFLVAALAVTFGAAAPMRAGAQAATARITGAITSGTPGVAIPDSVQVRVIVLEGSTVVEAIPATVSGGRYTATASIAPGRVFIPHLNYQGVDYFSEAASFTTGGSEATRDFLVYETTHEAPQLAILSSTVTVVAIDREQHQIGLLREDVVVNPGDRVFVGDAQGITLRIPALPGTVDASGDNTDGRFALDGDMITTAAPIRPGRPTSIVTRYIVGYDAAADQYALRVTSPLPAERIAVRVPVGYVGSVKAGTGARRAADERPAPQEQGPVFQVVESTGSVRPGGGIVVNLAGLSTAAVQTNPLTGTRGAAIAAAIALAIVGGGTAAAMRWRRAA